MENLLDFDARSILNKNDIKNSDLNFWRIGDGLEESKKNYIQKFLN